MRRKELSENFLVYCVKPKIKRRFCRMPYGEALVDEHTTDYENPYRFSGKELDDITGLYDHGARSRDPKITMWLNIDPLFEKYTDMSPYVYCAGNPVRFVDPDGMTYYEVDENGYITVKKDKTGNNDNFDMLYAKGKDDVEPLKVKNQNILKNLSQERTDYEGSYAETKSSEAEDIFIFAANNSKVEWQISKYKDGKSVVSTSHEEASVTSPNMMKRYDEKNMLFKVHSHPGADGTKGASVSTVFRDDMNNIIDMAHSFNKAGIYTEKNFPKHFIYHPDSKGLYQYTPYNSSVFLGIIGKKATLNKRILNSKSPFFNN